MKTFKEYLSESKKVYSFKVKVAGAIPEGFQDKLKTELDRCKLITLEKIASTPIQKFPLDFPNMSNAEVTVFEVICEYPINAQEIANSVKSIGLAEETFRVRGSSEPSEVDQLLVDNEPSGKALLADANYKESTNAKHKDYFGNDFNKGFLKDLEKTAKARKKEDGQGEYKLPKGKIDKAGAKSALGS